MLKHRVAFAFLGMLTICSIALAANRLYEGKVVLAGESRVTVVDKDGDNDDFLVTSSTKITRDGKSAKLEELEAGDRVRISAQAKGTSLVASEIEARSAE